MMRQGWGVRRSAHKPFVLLFLVISLIFGPLSAVAQTTEAEPTGSEPPVREGQLPSTSWDHLERAELWTRAALSALKSHGLPLTEMIPADYMDWCPAYAEAEAEDRRAFWVGFLSTLAKHESTYRPQVVGGGGLWFGLVQIAPATARGYGCRARSGEDLKHGPSNLSCAIRIMAVTVPRDGVVSARGRGVAADWGPLVSARKREDMMAWTREQPYCTPKVTVRPKVRPVTLKER